MPLYLATHTVEVVTAKVPLTMIMLLDLVKTSKTALPVDVRPRVVLPTSSTVSVSLWDAPSPEVLLTWLNENLQYDATHDVHEVQEEFIWGLSFELARVRAADKVAAGSRSTLDRISATAHKASVGIQHQLEALDQRSGIFSAAENAINRFRSAATTTSATGSAAATPTAAATAADEGLGVEEREGALLSEAAPTTSSVLAANVSAGLSKASSTFSWLGSTLKESIAKGTSTVTSAVAGTTRTNSNSQTPVDPAHPPPHYTSLFPGGGEGPAVGDEDAPLASLDTLPQLPVSSPAHAVGGANTPSSATATAVEKIDDGSVPPAPAEEHPSFTLDDTEDTPAHKAK